MYEGLPQNSVPRKHTNLAMPVSRVIFHEVKKLPMETSRTSDLMVAYESCGGAEIVNVGPIVTGRW